MGKLNKTHDISEYHDPITTISCDDGNGAYNKNYFELISELKNEFPNYQGAIDNGIFNEPKITYMTIDGIKCKINFMGSHYCGYIVDENITKNINPDDLDFQPHGGFTAYWGFDCVHAGDIGFIMCYHGYPSSPQNLIMMGDNSSFKTKKFIINELKKLIASIDRYNTMISDNKHN